MYLHRVKVLLKQVYLFKVNSYNGSAIIPSIHVSILILNIICILIPEHVSKELHARTKRNVSQNTEINMKIAIVS
jgi:hypothetical protein